MASRFDAQIDPNLSAEERRRARRMLSNRESARRSRHRKETFLQVCIAMFLCPSGSVSLPTGEQIPICFVVPSRVTSPQPSYILPCSHAKTLSATIAKACGPVELLSSVYMLSCKNIVSHDRKSLWAGRAAVKCVGRRPSQYFNAAYEEYEDSSAYCDTAYVS